MVKNMYSFCSECEVFKKKINLKDENKLTYYQNWVYLKNHMKLC